MRNRVGEFVRSAIPSGIVNFLRPFPEVALLRALPPATVYDPFGIANQLPVECFGAADDFENLLRDGCLACFVHSQ